MTGKENMHTLALRDLQLSRLMTVFIEIIGIIISLVIIAAALACLEWSGFGWVGFTTELHSLSDAVSVK